MLNPKISQASPFLLSTPQMLHRAHRSVAGASLDFGDRVIYDGHASCTSEVLAMASSCNALVWCGFRLDHVARVGKHMCGEVVFRTCVVHATMRFFRAIERHM